MVLRVWLVIVLCIASTASWAQFQTFRAGSVLVLDETSLLTQSKLGQDILSLEQSEQAEITTAGRLVTEQLEAEEALLTEQRLTLSHEEFRVLADAFNEKVETVRDSEAAVRVAQLTRVEARRRAFFQFISPQLEGMLRKYGAAAIIDRRYVLLSNPVLDITQELITLLDEAYEQNPDMIDLGN